MPSRTPLPLPLLCLLAVACGGGGREPVAHVGQTPVSRAELDQYLALNLLTDADDPPESEDMDRVKSRLLDALVEERRLVREAERLGLEVDDDEVAAFLQSYDDDPPGPARLDEDRLRALVRRRLLVRKLDEHVADKLPAPTDDEIEAYIAESDGRLAPTRRVLLRSLRFESPDDAVTCSARIREGQMSFEDAVETHRTGPSQGVVLDFSWAGLPEDVRAALEGLQPGEVTRPVGFNGETYLFQIEAWREKPTQMDEDLVRLARAELIRRRRRAAGERLRSDLRAQTPVQIHEQALPFRYVPDA